MNKIFTISIFILAVLFSKQAFAQSAFEKYLFHDASGRLISFNDGDRKIIFEKQKVKSVSTLDSIFSYYFEKNTITIVNDSGLKTNIIYGKYKAEIHYNDIIRELDSLEYMTPAGKPLTPMSSAAREGVTKFQKLNKMPVFDVYYNRFYPDSILVKTGGRTMWLGLTLWSKEYPASYLIDTSRNKYFCVLYGKNNSPDHFIIYDYNKREGIVFSSMKRNGKIDFIYINIFPPGAREADPVALFIYDNKGKVKKKIKLKLKNKHFLNALSVNRRISLVRKNRMSVK